MMQWADIARLYRYWNESPPVHELVAAYLRVKPTKVKGADRGERPTNDLSADEIVRGFQAGAPMPIGGL